MKKKTVFDFRTIKSFDDACKKSGIDPKAWIEDNV